MTEERLRELEQMLSELTGEWRRDGQFPGLWRTEKHDDRFFIIHNMAQVVGHSFDGEQHEWEIQCEDAKVQSFILSAKESMPDLIAEIRRLQAEVERLRPVYETVMFLDVDSIRLFAAAVDAAKAKEE